MTLALPPTAELEQVEAHEMARMYELAPPAVARELGLGHEWRGDTLVAWAPTLNVPMYNRALGIGLAGPATEAEVRAIAERFEREGSPRAFVQVAPGAAPDALPGWLEANGFQRFNRWVRWVRRAGDPPPESPGVTVELAGPELGRTFASIFGVAFGIPATIVDWVGGLVGLEPWRHYVARVDGEAVGVAALAVDGDYAWFGYAATLEAARGRGVQSTLLARRLADAARLGCSWAVVETAEDRPEKPAPSYRNMRRLGFDLAYLRDNWLRYRGGVPPA